jgi:hypothetical protein
VIRSTIGLGVIALLLGPAWIALTYALDEVADRDPATVIAGLDRVASAFCADAGASEVEQESAQTERPTWFRALAFHEGLLHAASSVESPDLQRGIAEALEELGRAIVCSPNTTLELHVETGRGSVVGFDPLRALSFVEGHDGVSFTCEGETSATVISGPELIRRNLHSRYRPLPRSEPSFRIGLDVGQLRDEHCAGRPLASLQRIRFHSAVRSLGATQPLARSQIRRKEVTRADVRASVLLGVEHLLAGQRPKGRFTYLQHPFEPEQKSKRYSWARHAGVAYSLALVGRLLDDEGALAGAERALASMTRRLRAAAPGMCFASGDRCYLGTASLLLLALSEQRMATGDRRFDAHAGAVADFLLAMQRPRGDFYHYWSPEAGVDGETMMAFASQQAALALARHARASGDIDAREAADQAMSYFAGDYWNFFLGNYFVGQEHWTCLAAEESASAGAEASAARFCREIANFFARLVLHPGESPFSEDIGGVGVSHVVTPHVGPTATVSEALVSAVLLAKAAGDEPGEVGTALEETIHFLVRAQIEPGDTYAMPDGEGAVGGFPNSLSKTTIRMDNVQHAISALVRALPLLGEDGRLEREQRTR